MGANVMHLTTIAAFSAFLGNGGFTGSQALLGAEDLGHLGKSPPGIRVQYGSDPLQFGELTLPPGDGPAPTVVYFHGGCWLDEYGDLSNSRALANALAASGVAVWSVEYRRVGNPGGGWPGTFEDAADGADHLVSLAKTYPLDLERVFAMGHSVGGHLALWLAARPELPEDSILRRERPLQIKGVVGLAAVPGLTKMFTDGVCGNSASRLMGGSPTEFPERYRTSSPSSFSPLGVPQCLVLGARDDLWLSHGRAYARVAREAGDADVSVIEAPDSGHFELMDPSTSTWPLVLDTVQALVQKQSCP